MSATRRLRARAPLKDGNTSLTSRFSEWDPFTFSSYRNRRSVEFDYLRPGVTIERCNWTK